MIVCGHYGCGAVRAALELPARTPGLVNCWISDIREARNQAARELFAMEPEDRVARLCELNVMRQVNQGAGVRAVRGEGGSYSRGHCRAAYRPAAPPPAHAALPLAPPRQVFHVCTSPVVQGAWAEGQELHVWGVIYDLADGLVRRLAGPFRAESEVDCTLVGPRGGGQGRGSVSSRRV